MANRPASIQPNNQISEMIVLDNDRSRPNTSNEGEDTSYIKNIFKERANSNRRQESKAKRCCNGRSRCSDNLSHYFSQYCGATSIHGIQYLGERGRFLIEKLSWTIVIITVCSLCLYLISKTYHKWVTSPVIVTFATTEMPIWNIPFPAVTICPEVKFNPEKFNYTNVLLKKILQIDVTAEEEEFLELSRIICDDDMGEIVDLPNGSFTIDRLRLLDLIPVIPDFDPYNVTDVVWLGEQFEPVDVLSATLTSSGLCYSFNMLNLDEIFNSGEKAVTNKSLNNTKARKWSLESGYPDDESDSYPRRTFLAGIDGGVTFSGLFANKSQLDYLCTEALQGFKVVLHHPSELPNLDKHFRVPLDQSVSVGIIPKMTSVSEELRRYSSKHRKCYFSDERKLRYFNTYTQQNCLEECFFNHTISKCKCMPLYMPYNPDLSACGPGSNKCVQESKVNFLAKKSNCDCLPFCTSLEYNVEITQTDWNWKEIFDTFRRLGVNTNDIPIDYKNSHLSKLTVFYKELQFLPSERHELYGYVDFFSNVGGLLGLFIGFSLTSFIEILYFLTLRLGCNIKKYGRKIWSGEAELINRENFI